MVCTFLIDLDHKGFIHDINLKHDFFQNNENTNVGAFLVNFTGEL